MRADADVVHEDVETAECSDGFGDDPFGLAGVREICDDMRGLADIRRVPSSTRDDEGTLGRELAHDLEPDTAGRAGDEAPLAAESKIHGRLG